jgi:hypothetical protein
MRLTAAAAPVVAAPVVAVPVVAVAAAASIPGIASTA